MDWVPWLALGIMIGTVLGVLGARREENKLHIGWLQWHLDKLTWPLTSQQWREMEFTFYAFRERLQGKPQRYLDADEDAPAPSAQFMAKLEARLQPTKSGTG